MTTNEGGQMVAAKLDTEECGNCDGAGAIWDDQTGQPDEPNGGRMVTCHVCKGEGTIEVSPCIACGAPIVAGLPADEAGHDEGCPVAEPVPA
jgi:DnaJ-class molecular chaperone